MLVNLLETAVTLYTPTWQIRVNVLEISMKYSLPGCHFFLLLLCEKGSCAVYLFGASTNPLSIVLNYTEPNGLKLTSVFVLLLFPLDDSPLLIRAIICLSQCWSYLQRFIDDSLWTRYLLLLPAQVETGCVWAAAQWIWTIPWIIPQTHKHPHHTHTHKKKTMIESRTLWNNANSLLRLARALCQSFQDPA